MKSVVSLLPTLLARFAPRRALAVRAAVGLAWLAGAAATVATGCAEQEADGLEAQYPVGSTPPRGETSSEAIDALTPPPGDAPPLPSEEPPPASAAPAGGPPGAGPDPAQGASVVIGDDPAAQGDEQANAAADDGTPPVDQVPPSMQGAPADAPPDTDPSALSAFRGALDPYGSWVDDPTYGTVWVPSPGAVGPDFTPYETAGHWAYDDSSYDWVSDYSWGWAPFHYGRWVYSRPVGWGWIPGRTYAGAWVSWRSGFDDWAYVGWAPLSPTWCWRHGAAVGLGFVPAAPYAFVSTRDLFAPRIATRLVTGSREATVAAHTRPYVAGATTTAGGRTLARPTVGGPSPSTLGIPQSAVVRTASYQAAARARSGGAAFAQGRMAGASVGPGQGAMQGRSVAPAYGPPVGSHFGGRFGAGFAGPGFNSRTDAWAFEHGAALWRSGAELHARRRRRIDRLAVFPGHRSRGRPALRWWDARRRRVLRAPQHLRGGDAGRLPRRRIAKRAGQRRLGGRAGGGRRVPGRGAGWRLPGRRRRGRHRRRLPRRWRVPRRRWSVVRRRTRRAPIDDGRIQESFLRLGGGGTTMSTWSLGAWAMGVAAAATSIAGCSVDTSAPAYSYGGGGTSGGGSSGSGSSGNLCGSTSSGSARPMLVDVDPDRTLNATGGEGVGVFTEYTTGGHWHIWWTCDTNASGYDCQYEIAVSVASGTISSFASESLENGDTSQACSATQVAASTNTAAGIDGITFDTSPSAVITVDAKINGAEDGSIMFFVQNGVVNGGYTGALTDPLMFEPASP